MEKFEIDKLCHRKAEQSKQKSLINIGNFCNLLTLCMQVRSPVSATSRTDNRLSRDQVKVNDCPRDLGTVGVYA